MILQINWKISPKEAVFKNHWRIFICIAIGAIIGPFVIPKLFPNIVYHFPSFLGLESVWSGSVVAGISGLIVGSTWQLTDKNRRSLTSGKLIIVLFILCVFYMLVGMYSSRPDPAMKWWTHG